MTTCSARSSIGAPRHLLAPPRGRFDGAAIDLQRDTPAHCLAVHSFTEAEPSGLEHGRTTGSGDDGGSPMRRAHSAPRAELWDVIRGTLPASSRCHTGEP